MLPNWSGFEKKEKKRVEIFFLRWMSGEARFLLLVCEVRFPDPIYKTFVCRTGVKCRQVRIIIFLFVFLGFHFISFLAVAVTIARGRFTTLIWYLLAQDGANIVHDIGELFYGLSIGSGLLQ